MLTPVQRNVLANYLGQGWTVVIQLAFIPLYIKYVGLEAYGVIGIFAVLQAWFTLLDMGIAPTLTREMARYTAGGRSLQSTRDLLRSLEMVYVSLALLIAAAVRLGSPFVASRWLKLEHLSPSSVASSLAIMGVVVALRFVEGIYRGCLFGLQRQVTYNAINVVTVTLRQGGAALVLAKLSATATGFFLWQAGVSLASVLLLAYTVNRTLPVAPSPARFSRDALAGVWRFAGGMMGITLLALLLTQVDKIILSRLLPLGAFGSYMLATAIAAALGTVVTPISQALYPRFVELASLPDARPLISLYHHGAQLVTAITAPAMLLLTLYSRGILFTWSGDQQIASRAAPVLSILCIGSFLNAMVLLPYQLQLAYGWTSLVVRTNALAVLLLVPAIFWVAPRYGAPGTAVIWALLNGGYVLGLVQLMHRRLIPDEKWTWYSRDVFLPLAGAALAALVSYPLRPSADAGRWHWLLFVGCAGAVMSLASACCSSRIRASLRARVSG